MRKQTAEAGIKSWNNNSSSEKRRARKTRVKATKILLEQPFTQLNYITIANTIMMHGKKSISSDAMKAIIDAQGAATADVLREVEDNFITSTKGHVTYHEQLMDMAKESGDMNGYMHHRVMMETYETILKNYEASRLYGSV